MKQPKKYKIAYLGKFNVLHNEEYIARSFEMVGCEVLRVPETHPSAFSVVMDYKPDFVLTAKFNVLRGNFILEQFRNHKIPTVSWTFDLYWDYTRESRIHTDGCFKTDLVITTDGGHDDRWESVGIRHRCVRQGIYKPECKIVPGIKKHNLIFVGSANPNNKGRSKILSLLSQRYQLRWFGRDNSDEVRGMQLNELYGKTRVVVGDSVESPHYWSNRVVETLGRGGFLIHKNVPGIKEEYPDLVTYETEEELFDKVFQYMSDDVSREEIVQKNFKHVLKNYTMDKKCLEVLSHYEDLIKDNGKANR